MIRVLYVARYRNAMMAHKIALMTQNPDMALWLVHPDNWEDEYGRSGLEIGDHCYHTIAVPMLGRTTDPHRALYRTTRFALQVVRPDIIHAEEEPDSLAALQLIVARYMFAPRAKLVLHTWQNVNRPKSWYVNWITQTSLTAASAILCANREAVAVLLQQGYAGMTDVIPPVGVDTRFFHPAASRAAAQTFTVLYAGRFVPEKGLDTLLEAVCHLGDDTRLMLVGAGPLAESLAVQAQTTGCAERVTFHAPVPADKMPAILAQADVLVLPSRGTAVWKEQYGRVLVEAMACGVPVVGSDSGAIPEVVGDAGLIFPEGDAGALVDRLRELRTSPALRSELARQGHARVIAHFSQERVAQQTIAFYLRLMAERKAEAHEP